MKSLWRELKWQCGIGLILAGLFAWVAFMAADNTPPYEYDIVESHVTPPVAIPGEQVTVKWKLAKVNRICNGWNRRVLFDPKTRVLLATWDPLPTALIDSISEGYLMRTFTLPKDIPSGETGYRSNVCYECNLFQKFVKPLCVATPELLFQVR